MDRVFINTRFLSQPLTGVQRYAQEITKELVKIDPQKYVLIGPQNIDINSSGLSEYKVLKVGSQIGHLWEQIDLVKFLRNNGKPLLLNLGNSSPIFYSNKITTLHDISFLVNPNWFSKKFVLWYRFMTPIVLKTSKLILTVSEFSKNEIIKNYKVRQQKIKVIYNSFNGKNKFSKITGIDKPFILAVDSPSERKNLKNIISAFLSINKEFPDIQLVLFGDYNHRSFPEVSEGNFHKSIIRLGKVSDSELAFLYSKAECLLFPTLYEGFGIPPLEAAYYGCISIVSNNSAFPEIYDNCAIFCDPLSIKDIVSKLNYTLSNPSLKTNFEPKFNQILQKYSWKESAFKIHELVKN